MADEPHPAEEELSFHFKIHCNKEIFAVANADNFLTAIYHGTCLLQAGGLYLKIYFIF
ncbi:MAG: hypothetical protein M3R36_15835 [Bacteroidota bacterium]|nr:hypothetical protein [Bacteroidota bacterium]